MRHPYHLAQNHQVLILLRYYSLQLLYQNSSKPSFNYVSSGIVLIPNFTLKVMRKLLLTCFLLIGKYNILSRFILGYKRAQYMSKKGANVFTCSFKIKSN